MYPGQKRYVLAFITILVMHFMFLIPGVSAKQIDLNVLLHLNNEKKSKEFYTDLDGEWVFFEQELLTPNEVEAQIRNHLGKIVMLPSSFESQTGDINSFGTYHVQLK